MDRFFCTDFPTQLGDTVALPDDEAHHASRVLRKVSGDPVELFDGRGRSVAAVLVDVRKKGVSVEIAGTVVDARPRTTQLTIAVAAPKADRFKWMIEKATELGVDRIIPLECTRSVVHPGGNKLEKLRATVVSACKQSGRNTLMTIDEPTAFQTVVAIEGFQRWVADVPEHSSSPHSIDREANQLILIGPEGGWTDEERIQASDAGFQKMNLGPFILRTETAAIAAATKLSC